MKVPKNHPLLELLGRLLFGIASVPIKEQTRMVRSAGMEAVKWHQNEVSRMRAWIKAFEVDAVLTNGNCPECGRRLGERSVLYNPGCHNGDCDLGKMVEKKKT